MKRSGGFFLRILTVIAGLALLGLVLKLTSSILTPILPVSFNSALSSGWNYLMGLVNPALPAIGALAILALLLWIVTGKGAVNMGNVISLVFTLLVLGYIARGVIQAIVSLWAYAIGAVVVLTILAVLVHH